MRKPLFKTTQSTFDQYQRLAWFFAAVAGMALSPGMVQASSGGAIQGAYCGLVNMFSGTTALAVGATAIIILGLSALANKISWGMASLVAAGIASLIGASNMLSALTGQGDICATAASSVTLNSAVNVNGSSSIQNTFCQVLAFLTGTPGVALAMVGVLGLAACAMFGKVSWGMAVTVGVGIALILGTAGIMEILMSGVGNGSNATCSAQPAGGGSATASMPGSCVTGDLTALIGVGFVEMLVNCFTGDAGDSGDGIIPNLTKSFLNVTQAYYLPIVQVLFTLVVVMFAIRLLSGQVEHVKETTFTLLFKIGGVMYFMSNAPALYTEFLGLLYSLTDAVAGAAASAGGGGICSVGGTTDALWSTWDCVLSWIFGFANGAVVAGVGSFLFLISQSGGPGYLVAAVGLYFLSGLFFSMVRFIHMFLMTILGFSFVFAVSYLFVPLVLFKGSFEAFQRWLNLVISLMVTPIIIIGYMGMMMVAVNYVLFTGSFSLWATVGAGCAGAGGGSDAFGSATSTSCVVSSFKTLFYIDSANSSVSSGNSSGSSGSSSSNSSGGDGTNGQTCDALSSGSSGSSTGGGGSSGTQNGGLLGQVRNEGITGTAYQKNPPPASNPFGFETHALQQACANLNNYSLNVLVAFAGAALLMYVMYSLMDYIPAMAGELASQGMDTFTSALGKQSQQGSMPGQKGMNQMIQGATGVAPPGVGGGGGG